jgi:peptidoglycan-associated lipoprotein
MSKGIATAGKRWLVLLASLLLIFGLTAGCGGGKKPVQTETTQMPPPEPIPAPPAPEPEEEEGTGAPAIDYAAMEPQEYGIGDVFFAFDVYTLDDEAMQTLNENAAIMKQHPDLVWLVEGHCDERGTVEYNLALGEKRAQTTQQYLVRLGVPAEQLRITSYGESRPFVHGHTEAAWAANRRAHFAQP